jgi:hypothetical protein
LLNALRRLIAQESGRIPRWQIEQHNIGRKVDALAGLDLHGPVINSSHSCDSLPEQHPTPMIAHGRSKHLR